MQVSYRRGLTLKKRENMASCTHFDTSTTFSSLAGGPSAAPVCRAECPDGQVSRPQYWGAHNSMRRHPGLTVNLGLNCPCSAAVRRKRMTNTSGSRCRVHRFGPSSHGISVDI